MNAISNVNESFYKSVSLFKGIENLPSELIDRIITTALFSETQGSHDALHTLESLSRDEKHPTLRRRIAIVFKSQSLRKQIEAHWQLRPDFDHAKRHPCNEHKASTLDLASWTIYHCYRRCFKFLLDHGSIRASCFSKTGDSFFALAIKNGQTTPAEHILSLIDSKQLFQPYTLQGSEDNRRTILQVSTSHELWFKACWEKVIFQSNIDLSYLLGLTEIANIARYASVKLAMELLDRGVDLGRSFPYGAEPGPWWPGWWGVLSQESPAPILAWLWGRGHKPPAGYLVSVASIGCIAAASWLLPRTECYRDWQQAAFTAAGNIHPWSVEMLHLILKHQRPEWNISSTFAQTAAIKVVDCTCDRLQSWRCSRTSTQPQADIRDQQMRKALISELEQYAVAKIQCLRRFESGIGVIGLAVKARHSGLHRLTEALDELII